MLYYIKKNQNNIIVNVYNFMEFQLFYHPRVVAFGPYYGHRYFQITYKILIDNHGCYLNDMPR